MATGTTGTSPGTELSQISDTQVLIDPNNPVVSHPTAETTNQEVQTFFDTHTDTQTTVKHILSQTTSIPQSSTTSYIGDFNISAYMRKQEIDVVSYNLRPNRKVYPFFDDRDISNIFERANIIEVDNDAEFLGMLPMTASVLPVTNVDANGNIVGQIDTAAERIYTSTGSARVYFTEKTETGTTRLYVDCFKPNVVNVESMLFGTGTIDSGVSATVGNVMIITGATTVNGFTVGDTILGSKSGSLANIVSYYHSSGKLTGGSWRSSAANTYGVSNTVFNKVEVSLSREASTEDGYYVGQTLILLTGENPGESAEIISYDGNTRSCIISPPFRGFTTQDELFYTLADARDNYVSTSGNNSIYTTAEGFLAGKIHLPSPGKSSYYRWRTGERVLKITDSPTNKSADASTIAEYVYNSFGLSLSKGQTVINYFTETDIQKTGQSGISGPTPEPLSPPLITGSEITVTEQQLQTGSAPGFTRRYNPIAQSFYVSPEEYPKGFFVPYIDIFFSKKGTLPVSMEIRPLINGAPDSKNIVPGAIAVVPANLVKVSSRPDVNDANTYTRFTFNSPVYLLPDADYVFTIGSNDYDYEVYVSELGEKIIGSDRLVSQQPYLGNLFKSQNSSTYDAIQSEDMMFVIHKCQFISSGFITFHEEKAPNLYELAFRKYYDANTKFDSFEVQSDVIKLSGTDVNYQYKTVTASTETLDEDFTPFIPDRRVILTNRKMVKSREYEEETFLMEVDLTTTNRDISPVLYKEKQNIHTATTIINNMGLGTRGVQVANTGTGYTFSNTSVTITGNTGSGANAMILTQFQDYSEGRIETLYFDQAGSGYYDNVEITLTSSTGSGAVLTYSSETDPTGGPAVARYISKIITLAPEFEAGDLRVFLTAVKPPEAEIQVYYKVRNAYDDELIDAKKWTRMARKVGITNDTIGFTPMEYEYTPSLEANNIVYSTEAGGTFTTFNQFKIKIVMSSSDTVFTKIPYVYDMRAIALPGDVTE